MASPRNAKQEHVRSCRKTREVEHPKFLRLLYYSGTARCSGRSGCEAQGSAALPHRQDPKTEEEPMLIISICDNLITRRHPQQSRDGVGSRVPEGKATISRPTNTMPSANEHSPDKGSVPSTSTDPTGLTSPPLLSPIPAHFALLQAHRRLASPEPGMFYPRTPPPTRIPPTLQDTCAS
jgi:hypothetical protein